MKADGRIALVSCANAALICAMFAFTEECGATGIAKIAPDPVVVHVRHGDGAQRVVFLKDAGAPVPNVVVSDAPGAFSVIPKADIAVDVEGSPEQRVFSVGIRVSTKQPITRGVTHNGVLLLTPGSSDATPVQVLFAIQDDAAVNAEVLEASLDAVSGLGEPESSTFVLRNTGNVAIDKVKIATSRLTDGTTHDGYELTPGNADLEGGQIGIYQERIVSFNVGHPKIAGIFVGDLYITLNNEKTIKLPITIRSRGPLAEYELPLLLFVLVVGLGFWLSSVLNSWFSGGGLERAQAGLSLRNVRTELAAHDTRLQRWLVGLSVNTPPPKTPRAQLRLLEYLSDLDLELARLADLTPAELTLKVEYFASAVSISDLFWSALSLAAAKWAAAQTQLATVVDALDDVAPSTSAAGVAAYRDALNAAMSNTSVSLGVPSGGAPSVQQAAAKWNPDTVKKKIKRMALLYGATVFVTVLATAYQSFYAHNLGFGALSDYIVVGLWALGLTTTGTQILSRIHK
jgi:hypothetical protein